MGDFRVPVLRCEKKKLGSCSGPSSYIIKVMSMYRLDYHYTYEKNRFSKIIFAFLGGWTKTLNKSCVKNPLPNSLTKNPKIEKNVNFFSKTPIDFMLENSPNGSYLTTPNVLGPPEDPISWFLRKSEKMHFPTFFKVKTRQNFLSKYLEIGASDQKIDFTVVWSS